MAGSRWGGRKVARLTAIVLAVKGSTCWLCGMPGADSPDHDPPRVELLARGVLDPDAVEYLHPSHRLCNIWRKDRPVTAALRAELLSRRRSLLALDPEPGADTRSPLLARRQPSRTLLFESPPRRGSDPFPVPPRSPKKTD